MYISCTYHCVIQIHCTYKSIMTFGSKSCIFTVARWIEIQINQAIRTKESYDVKQKSLTCSHRYGCMYICDYIYIYLSRTNNQVLWPSNDVYVYIHHCTFCGNIHIVTNYCVFPGPKSSRWNQGGSSRDQRSQPCVNVWDHKPPTWTP